MLELWDSEPGSYHLLAVFAGQSHQFEKFLQVWLDWRGDLNMLVAPITREELPWVNAFDAKQIDAYVVSVAYLPSYFLIKWLHDQSCWRLFYKELPINDDRDHKISNSDDIQALKPHGLYLPWGYKGKQQLEFNQAHNGDAFLLHTERPTLPIPLPSVKEFRNLSSLNLNWQALLIGADGPSRPARALSPETTAPTYTIPMSLRSELEYQHPTNPQAVTERLERNINDLREQLEIMRWWKDPIETNYMYVYCEKSGSLRNLRDWFVKAPDQAIRQYNHARVVLKELENKLGALHLITLNGFSSEPEFNLPLPDYQLVSDWRWKRKGLNLFVPKGWELLPHPPRQNERIEELMIECLWGNKTLKKDMLIVLQVKEGEEYRFTVSGFKRLDEQTSKLNIQAAIKLAERNQKREEFTGIEKLLTQVRQEVLSRLAGHAEIMQDRLNSLWNEDRKDLDKYRGQVKEALDQVQSIKDWQAEISQLRNMYADSWSGFRNEVMQLDRQVVPTICYRVRNELGDLDQIRAELSVLWMDDTPEERKKLSSRLMELANQIGR